MISFHAKRDPAEHIEAPLRLPRSRAAHVVQIIILASARIVLQYSVLHDTHKEYPFEIKSFNVSIQ
jgi:hypothetical protein